MKGYTYIDDGKFDFTDKAKPELQSPKDAVVRVTLSSICTSDLHIKHGSVPRACKGITVGHEMVGVVEATGSDVMKVKPGDRVAVNVETFCGECFYCKRGWVNNCEKGGWELGCRIDGAQAEYVRVPYARTRCLTSRLFLSEIYSLPDIGLPKLPKSPRMISCLSLVAARQAFAPFSV